jgi:hypothetical protein
LNHHFSLSLSLFRGKSLKKIKSEKKQKKKSDGLEGSCFGGRQLMLGDDVKLVGREEVLTDVENCLCRLLHTFPLPFFLFNTFGGLEFFPEPELLDFYPVLFFFFYPPSPTPSHVSATKRHHLLANVRRHSFFMSTVSNLPRFSRYISLGNWLCPNTILIEFQI